MPDKPRNYAHEYALDKAKTKQVKAKLRLDEAAQLQKYLDENGIGFTDWVRLKLRKDTDNEAQSKK